MAATSRSHAAAILGLLGSLIALDADAASATPRVQRKLGRVDSQRLVREGDFQYLGAFRLPEAAADASAMATFDYGGQGMSYRADGDPGGGVDGFPGSLFVTGLDAESWVAEISIPAPVVSAARRTEDLPVARLLQPFADVRGTLFRSLVELPRVGVCWLSAPQTGARVHLAWGQHFQESPEHQLPSHASFSPLLAAPDLAGAWWIGQQALYAVNGYLFEIEQAWTDAPVGGRRLATGRFRDGGWSGRGPSLFAYAPWLSGTPPAPGTRLAEVPLLLYSHTRADVPDLTDYRLAGYQHSDEWEGGAWITTPRGTSAVAFVGTKGIGAYYWYGWLNPVGPDVPCVEVAEGSMCFRADGTPCPPELAVECAGHTSDRGWWSTRMAAMILLYDPNDLAAVARGALLPGQPQPYARFSIDDRLFLPDPCTEATSAGTGVQRRYRVGDVGFDRESCYLYVLEQFADGPRPLAHVWRIR